MLARIPAPRTLARHLPPLAIAMLGFFAALNIGDLISTYVDLHAGLREGNPLMNHLLASHGFGALIAYKVVVITLVGVVTANLWRTRPKLVGYTLLACDVLIFAAVTSNIIQFPA